MIVWGGTNSINSPIVGINTGGIYNPTSNTWTTTTLVNAPTPRVSNSAIWTGSEMIIWGGVHEDVVNNTGARYNPASNEWIATSSTNSPSARSSHSSIWTGSEQIIWGGGDNNTSFNDGKNTIQYPTDIFLLLISVCIYIQKLIRNHEGRITPFFKQRGYSYKYKS